MTYYEETLLEKRPETPLSKKKLKTDVCVIGAGLAGLHVALSLSERGKTVVVLEKKQIGNNASGKNAGMVCSGYQQDPLELINLVGTINAKIIWKWAEEAQNKILSRIKMYKIDCNPLKTGLLTLSCFKSFDPYEYTIKCNETFGTSFQAWNMEEVQKKYKSKKYYSGIFDPHSFVLHPLNYLLGLGRACLENKVQILENTTALSFFKNKNSSHKYCVCTSETSIECNSIVITNSYSKSPSFDRTVSNAITSAWTYIMVSEPLEADVRSIIGEHPVCDDKVALSYYRLLPDNRLLWGGLIDVFPDKTLTSPLARLKKDLTTTYPQLSNINIHYIWKGKLCFGWDLMPIIKMEDDVWTAVGFGGHGLVPTCVCGELIASAIASGDSNWKLFSNNFPPKYLGVFSKFLVLLHCRISEWVENITIYFQ